MVCDDCVRIHFVSGVWSDSGMEVVVVSSRFLSLYSISFELRVIELEDAP